MMSKPVWQKKWFKFHTDSVESIKVQSLQPHLYKTWVNCMCLAAKRDGIIPSPHDLAFHLRMSAKDASDHTDELISLGMIDVMPDGRMTPHDWAHWQAREDRSMERMRRLRKRNKKNSDASRDDKVTDGGDASVTDFCSTSTSVSPRTYSYQDSKNSTVDLGSASSTVDVGCDVDEEIPS
jgi:hypothetical protein